MSRPYDPNIPMRWLLPMLALSLIVLALRVAA